MAENEWKIFTKLNRIKIKFRYKTINGCRVSVGFCHTNFPKIHQIEIRNMGISKLLIIINLVTIHFKWNGEICSIVGRCSRSRCMHNMKFMSKCDGKIRQKYHYKLHFTCLSIFICIHTFYA